MGYDIYDVGGQDVKNLRMRKLQGPWDFFMTMKSLGPKLLFHPVQTYQKLRTTSCVVKEYEQQVSKMIHHTSQACNIMLPEAYRSDHADIAIFHLNHVANLITKITGEDASFSRVNLKQLVMNGQLPEGPGEVIKGYNERSLRGETDEDLQADV